MKISPYALLEIGPASTIGNVGNKEYFRDGKYAYYRTVFTPEKPPRKHKELPNYIKKRMELVENGMKPEDAIKQVPKPKWFPRDDNMIVEEETKTDRKSVV